MEDPRQTELFDTFQSIVWPVAYGKLPRRWQHLFRRAILKLLPATKLGEHFHPAMGRPTKELSSLAGRPALDHEVPRLDSRGSG
jgi:hypothetical protein